MALSCVYIDIEMLQKDPVIDVFIYFFLRPEIGLLVVDHIVGNQPDLAMNNVVEW